VLSFAKRAILVGLTLLLGTPALAARNVTDELGRHVTVPDHPQRIICLAPSLTETVYALGLGDAIAGVTDYTTFPPKARTKPSVGGLVDPSMEKIMSLHPDLVLAMDEINRKETVEQLERFGISVFVISPHGLQGILLSIQHIGEVLNRTSEARALVTRLEAKEDAVVARVKGLARPKVFVDIWYDPVITAGGKAFITEVISAAGGESVTADIPQAWPQISMEEVLRLSPDFLILMNGSHGGITLEELKTREGWDRLEAVRQNHVIYMDERLEHPSPVVFDALEDLAKKLHPEAFEPK
jgi:iron complex transport system substrate-binding protein